MGVEMENTAIGESGGGGLRGRGEPFRYSLKTYCFEDYFFLLFVCFSKAFHSSQIYCCSLASSKEFSWSDFFPSPLKKRGISGKSWCLGRKKTIMHAKCLCSSWKKKIQVITTKSVTSALRGVFLFVVVHLTLHNPSTVVMETLTSMTVGKMDPRGAPRLHTREAAALQPCFHLHHIWPIGSDLIIFETWGF